MRPLILIHYYIILIFSANNSISALILIADGDWKITVVTGNLPNAGTDATVSLYVYGEGSNSGPIVLGSGSHQLFNVNSADTFQVCS